MTNSTWSTVVGSLTVLAISAGGGGLLIASSTAADVETLKDQAPAAELRMQAVEIGLSALKGATDERADHDAEFRDEQRQANKDLARKLDALLARPK